jgi:hypothetical protein
MEDIIIRGRGQRRVEFGIYIRELAKTQYCHEDGDPNIQLSKEQRDVIEEGRAR